MQAPMRGKIERIVTWQRRLVRDALGWAVAKGKDRRKAEDLSRARRRAVGWRAAAG